MDQRVVKKFYSTLSIIIKNLEYFVRLRLKEDEYEHFARLLSELMETLDELRTYIKKTGEMES